LKGSRSPTQTDGGKSLGGVRVEKRVKPSTTSLTRDKEMENYKQLRELGELAYSGTKRVSGKKMGKKTWEMRKGKQRRKFDTHSPGSKKKTSALGIKGFTHPTRTR